MWTVAKDMFNMKDVWVDNRIFKQVFSVYIYGYDFNTLIQLYASMMICVGQ